MLAARRAGIKPAISNREHQRDGRAAETNRIKGSDVEQHGAQQAHSGNGTETAGNEADENDGCASLQDQAEDSAARRTQSHAQSKLAIAFDHGVGHHRVESHHGDEHAANGVDAEQFRGDARHLILLAGNVFESANVLKRQR